MLSCPSYEKPVFLSFENCVEEKVPELLSKLRPLLFSFCLENKCFYSLYTRPARNNKYSFGLSFYSFVPTRSAIELELVAQKVFVNYFNKESELYGTVKCVRFLKGFSKFFNAVNSFSHLQFVVKPPASISAPDFCFSLMENFEFNVVTFQPESKLFNLKHVAYCAESSNQLIFLIQNDANFKGYKVLTFIEERPHVYGEVLFCKAIIKKENVPFLIS
jgi:hypothetical protein